MPRPDENVPVEVIKGKNGAVVTRTMRPDGTGGREAREQEGRHHRGDGQYLRHGRRGARHDSQSTSGEAKFANGNRLGVRRYCSDLFEDRDATQQIVIRSGVIFNSMTVELRTLFKMLMPIAKPVTGMLGVSIYGSAKRLAQQSGGEALKVNRTKDYANGLAKIIGNLTAR